MDKLHEDLNRILHKPLTNSIEGKKEDKIEDIARKSWITFMKRNYSFVTNLFYG